MLAVILAGGMASTGQLALRMTWSGTLPRTRRLRAGRGRRISTIRSAGHAAACHAIAAATSPRRASTTTVVAGGLGMRRVAGPHVDQAQHAAGHAADPRRHRQRRICLARRAHGHEDPAEPGVAVPAVYATAGHSAR